MNHAETHPSKMSIEEIRERLNPVECTVACNPVISRQLREIITNSGVPVDFGNYDVRCYYTDQLAEQLLHEPDEHGFADIKLSDVAIKELLMLEKAYDILMFVAL